MPTTSRTISIRSALPLLLFLAAAVLAASPAAAIQVDTFVDENGDGPGSCALREAVRAIMDAASFGGCSYSAGDTLVELQAGTYVLSIDARIDIDSPVTIQGQGPSATFIERDDPHSDDYFFVTDTLAGAVVFEELTLRGQRGGPDRAVTFCIGDASTLTIRDVVFFDNQGVDAPALRVDNCGSDGSSTIELERVVFEQNHAEDSFATGGAASFECELDATATVTMTDVLFRGNSANGTDGGAVGGAVFVTGCTVTLRNVTFDDNSVTATDIAGGGALFLQDYFGLDASLSATNVTFFGNSAELGGALVHAQSGSGSTATATLNNVTFAANTATEGDHLFQLAGAPLTLTNVLFGPSGGDDCAGDPAVALNSGGGNMQSDGSCGLAGAGDQTEANPGLDAALADNGGFTPTLALLPGAAAVDAGVATGCPSDDQRGVARPQDGDGNFTAICDVGAFELEGVLAPPAALAVPTLSLPLLGLLALGLTMAAWWRLSRSS